MRAGFQPAAHTPLVIVKNEVAPEGNGRNLTVANCPRGFGLKYASRSHDERVIWRLRGLKITHDY